MYVSHVVAPDLFASSNPNACQLVDAKNKYGSLFMRAVVGVDDGNEKKDGVNRITLQCKSIHTTRSDKVINILLSLCMSQHE